MTQEPQTSSSGSQTKNRQSAPAFVRSPFGLNQSGAAINAIPGGERLGRIWPSPEKVASHGGHCAKNVQTIQLEGTK